MKQAVVFLRDKKAGVLTEDENGYTFQYDRGFLHSDDAEAISLTLPLSEKPFHDKVIFPFFDEIDVRDRMSLLLACCKDCIGAVGVEPIRNEEE